MGKWMQILTRSRSSHRFDDRFAQVACYAGSLVVLVAGILKLCRMGLDEAHLFLGLLLVLCLSVLGVIGGSCVCPRENAE